MALRPTSRPDREGQPTQEEVPSRPFRRPDLAGAWSRRRLRNASLALLASLAVVLGVLGLVVMTTVESEQEARAETRRAAGAILALDGVLEATLDAETGQRGYLLTMREDYLQPYLSAKERLVDARAELERQFASQAGSGTRYDIARIEVLLDEKMQEVDRTVSLARSGQVAAAISIVQSDFGKRQMDGIRREIQALKQAETEDLEGALARAERLEERLTPLLTLLAIAIVALVVTALILEQRRAASEAEAAQAGALREANRQSELLTRELNHRVKNLFSVILSIISISARKKGAGPEVLEDVRARVHALSMAHSASQGAGIGETVAIGDLLNRIMEPYGSGEQGRVMIDGPPRQLPLRMVTSLGLIVHELATNAVKYGALSMPQGSVTVSWKIEPDEQGEQNLALTWIESGGPVLSVDNDAGLGFGTRLAELAAQQLSGAFHREFHHDGVRAELRFPLPLS